MTRSYQQRSIAGTMALVMAYGPLLAAAGSTDAFAQTAQNTTYQYSYDAQGNLLQVTDPLNRTANQSVDALNRVKQRLLQPAVAGGARPAINLTYDGLDQVATVSDPRALVTAYTTDGLGNQTALASPDTGSSGSTYDLAGNTLTSTDARGKVTTYTYDVLNRLTSATYASGTPSVYEYDGGPGGAPNAIGRLTKITDESGQTLYSYDQLGRVLSKMQTTSLVAGSLARTVSYAYDNVGRLASLTYPSGARVNYGYDSTGKVNSLSLNPPVASGGTDLAVTTILLDQISYAPFGAVQSWVWGNNTSTAPNVYARNFDLDGRVTSYPLGNGQAAVPGLLRTLTYDAASNITAITHTGNATAGNYDQQFGYDGLDRLVSFSRASGSQGYAYDANGNRSQIVYGASTYANSISATSNRLNTTAGPLPAKANLFDNAGNLTSDGTITYGYSDRGRLSSSVNAGVNTSYLYNAVGQRVSKSSPLAASGSTVYAYDEAGKVLGEYTGDGAVAQETVFLGDLPVVIIKPAAGTSGALVHYVYADHLNTARVITSAATGETVWRWDNVDPFGAEQPNENPAAQGNFVYNARFPGQLFDKETNTHYNYYRDYDPQTGRYIQSDPIGLGGGVNTYSYALGNPIRYSDPTGLVVVVDDAVILGGIAITAACAASSGCRKAISDAAASAARGARAAGSMCLDLASRARNWFENSGGGPKVPPNLQPNTNPPQSPNIPNDWESRPGRNGGEVYYPPGTDPATGENIRVMPPGSTPVPGLEDGYWIWTNGAKQPIDPSTGKPGGKGQTHVPLPPGGVPPPRRP